MKDKVLLVDDEAMVLAGLKRQLRNKFSIDTALSGEEALKQVQQKGPYAVIVSDYMMPGMNGVEFLAHVKKTNPDTVRMMLTGTADMPTAIRASGRYAVPGDPKRYRRVPQSHLQSKPIEQF
jgi:CheY-like chemotaxis protein